MKSIERKKVKLVNKKTDKGIKNEESNKRNNRPLFSKSP